MLMQPGPLATDLLCLLSSAALVVGYHLVLRLLPLLVDLFWAFFCFTLDIRANNHVGYLIVAGDRHAVVTPAAGEPQPDQEIANPVSPARFRVVKRLVH